MSGLLSRLGSVPPFTLGFVLLCLLQSGVDRVDPTSGQVERFVGLLLLAFAVAGLVVALLRDEPPVERTGSALAGLLLRGGLVASGGLLLLLVLADARLNPLADLQFVVALLLTALVALRHAYDPTAAVDSFLARWAVPFGATAFLVSLPLTAAKLLALP